MRNGMIVLAALAFGMSGAAAMAQTGRSVEAFAPHPDQLAPRLGHIVIGGGYHAQNMLLAQLNEHTFGHRNDTMEQEPDGGMSMAGSAGGIGD